ncbi:MAG: cellulase family glycosylhydrolase [Coriobacteriales bacterium]|nr:cellulase family glycosylhydrolase [Coriobacteriales bacterium]
MGNWLVLEKWMGASPLAAAQSPDDRGLIDEFDPDELDRVLEEFRQTYVTRDTFAWLARTGVNLVRLPVPYHLFGSAHHRPCVQYLDHAMDWAAEYGLGVLVDLHTVPLGQNGFDNGGYVGMCAWHRDPARVEYVLEVLERIARRYAGHPALWGIEPLNEPANRPVFVANMRQYGRQYPERRRRSRPMSFRALRGFYERCYALLRPIVGPEVALVFHDRFELWRWNRVMVGDAYCNVWIDTHQYLCFADGRLRTCDLAGYGRLARRMARRLGRAARHHKILVGEWCLGNHASQLAVVSEEEQRAWYAAFAAMQHAVWDVADGECFWSLSVEGERWANWSFEECIRRGWL